MSVRKRRSALAILCAEALKEEKERERERDCEEVHSRSFVSLIPNIIKMKFLWT